MEHNVTEHEVYEAICIINMQVLHQWRFMNDEVYRIEYYEFLDELGLSMQIIMDEKLLLIPMSDIEDDTDIIFAD